jgi:hypothetical protein
MTFKFIIDGVVELKRGGGTKRSKTSLNVCVTILNLIRTLLRENELIVAFCVDFFIRT